MKPLIPTENDHHLATHNMRSWIIFFVICLVVSNCFRIQAKSVNLKAKSKAAINAKAPLSKINSPSGINLLDNQIMNLLDSLESKLAEGFRPAQPNLVTNKMNIKIKNKIKAKASSKAQTLDQMEIQAKSLNQEDNAKTAETAAKVEAAKAENKNYMAQTKTKEPTTTTISNVEDMNMETTLRATTKTHVTGKYDHGQMKMNVEGQTF